MDNEQQQPLAPPPVLAMEVEPAPVQLPAAADPMAPGPVDAAVQGGAQPPAPGGNPVVPQNPTLGGGPGGAVAQAEAVQPVQPAAPPAPVAAVAPAGPAPFDHQALVQMQLQLMQQMQQQQAAFMQVIPALIPRAPAAEPQKPRGNPAKGTLAPFTEREDPERFFERFEIFMSYERTLTPRDALLFACRDYAAAESYALALPSDISLIALKTGNKRRNLLPAGRGSNPLGLTKIRGPDGRLLSHLEWGMFKAKGLCLTCGQAGHRAAECPNKENKPPKK
ncbi:hypothetical protein HYH03_007815 [Edaphochlamys debaryana]|uniref:CCHC-type domain-containing protein n=1 Tax=Edaphochlamys debaryana TaxID=47281 RepID=A0A835XZH4_9CHLO|nr:hypothetical protein HYH03_007815 [Edaphochlamys debaryana]|eukprot:KAG2493877.1 hypothetical protein HYH03_007815 [Edaphochlamys debaryana]